MKARIETGRLKINSVRCPNLLAEARHYRREEGSETPVDEYNHALGALRYMISRIDSRFMARLRRQRTAEGLLPEIEEVTDEDREETVRSVYAARPWLRVDNEQLWE